MAWIVRIRESIRSSLWAIPTVCVAIAVAMSIGAVRFDRSLAQDGSAWYLFGGSADGAKTLLSATSASMLTFIALVFSITIVALQLASGQFSPRVQRAFLRDTLSKLTLGVFIGTFTYSILILRIVRAQTTSDEGFVPGLGVTVAVVLVLLSVAFFVRYIDHIAHSIRAISVIRNVASETTALLDNQYEELAGDEPVEASFERPADVAPDPIASKTSGVLVGVKKDRLLHLAAENGVLIEVIPFVGDFVPHGGEIALVWGTSATPGPDEIRAAVSIGPERTMRQDLAFGIRQLVDIAERALSPGINDPSTAVQVLDALHDILRRVVTRRFPDVCLRSEDGSLRVVLPHPSWDALLSLALDEIQRAGRGSLQIARRLRSVLDDLRDIAPAARLSPIMVRLERLDRTNANEFVDALDLERASRPSRQGQL